MKHNLKVTFTILALYLIIQLVGLVVINAYTPQQIFDEKTNQTINANSLPFGMEPLPEQQAQTPLVKIISFIISLTIAIAIVLFIVRFNLKYVIKIWFLIVVILAMAITIFGLTKNFWSAPLIALIISTPLALLKVFRPTVISHNFTEILVYPGIAAIFVSLLTPFTAILLLILISLYDAWAVWHVGIMQKMARYQMNEVKVFGGLMIPSITKKQKEFFKRIKNKKQNLKRKIKVRVAVLGGGDIIFPLIAAGVFYRAIGIIPALFIILGATLGLSYILFDGNPKKVYPAMPFISSGIFLALALYWLIF